MSADSQSTWVLVKASNCIKPGQEREPRQSRVRVEEGESAGEPALGKEIGTLTLHSPTHRLP